MRATINIIVSQVKTRIQTFYLYYMCIRTADTAFFWNYARWLLLLLISALK